MTEEYIGEIHTDPTVIDEIAYACFWFESSTLEEELYREGIPIKKRILTDMLARVQDRIHMWLNFNDKLTQLIEPNIGLTPDAPHYIFDSKEKGSEEE